MELTILLYMLLILLTFIIRKQLNYFRKYYSQRRRSQCSTRQQQHKWRRRHSRWYVHNGRPWDGHAYAPVIIISLSRLSNRQRDESLRSRILSILEQSDSSRWRFETIRAYLEKINMCTTNNV